VLTVREREGVTEALGWSPWSVVHLVVGAWSGNAEKRLREAESSEQRNERVWQSGSRRSQRAREPEKSEDRTESSLGTEEVDELKISTLKP